MMMAASALLRRAARAVRRTDARIVRRYFAQTREFKLHLGCGTHVLAGWLNADRAPRRADILRLDATRPFPFPTNTFAYVYSEHLIGSLSFDGAAAMLRECHRVLTPGGKVRIATPDLAFLTGLLADELSATQQRYVEWFRARTAPSRRRSRTHGACEDAGFVVNQYLNAWSLEVVYDEAMLRTALEAAGFCAATRHDLAASDETALRDLANEKRLPADVLRLESLTIEATKIASPPPRRSGRTPKNRRLNGASSSVRNDLVAQDPPRIRRHRMIRHAHTVFRSLPRTFRRADARMIRRHFAHTSEPKLHLGCGDHLLAGWLNTDRWPRCQSVARLDASRPFPLPDNSFAYVYSEYMLASLSLSEARIMLRECHRVLAPGGKLRIATTDLAFLIRLYQSLTNVRASERPALEECYVRWTGVRRMARCEHSLCRDSWRRSGNASDDIECTMAPVTAGAFLNHHLHTNIARVVYDASMLSEMLTRAGFTNITRCDPNRSEHPAFCDLPNERRMPDGFYRLECLTVEGTKPAILQCLAR